MSIVAQSIESTLSEKKETIEAKVRELLETTRNAFYIGRGQDYYVAMEASLKLKEISYIQCEGFAAGELKHGTIALIEEGTPVWPSCQIQFCQPHLVEISKRSQPVVPRSSLSQKKMLLKTQTISSLRLSPLPLTNFNGRTNTIGRLLCNTPPWT